MVLGFVSSAVPCAEMPPDSASSSEVAPASHVLGAPPFFCMVLPVAATLVRLAHAMGEVFKEVVLASSDAASYCQVLLIVCKLVLFVFRSLIKRFCVS